MSSVTSSVLVVEIDTRKGSERSVFDSSLGNQNEQAKQFWKTFTLPPHIESSLYSKEINQQLKTNKLKPISIDNSRKVVPPDPKIEAFLKNVEVLNHIDDVMKLQKKFEKFQAIKHSHRIRKEKFNQMTNANHHKLVPKLDLKESSNESDRNYEGPNDEDYEIDYENEESLVKNLE